MLRQLAIAATMTLLCLVASSGQEPKGQSKPEAPAPAPKKVPTPDTGRYANPGDEAEIYDADTPAGLQMHNLAAMIVAKNANDRVGMDRIKAQRSGCLLPLGTKILVIKLYLRKVDMTPVSPDQYASELSAGVGRERPLETAQVRVLDGPFKDEALYVPVNSVAVLKFPPPPPPQPKPKPKPKPATPESRAASLLSAARNLEKSGKPGPALENYRKIAADFGETPSAREAGERIKALTGK